MRAPAFWIVVATLVVIGLVGWTAAGASFPLLLVFEPTILLTSTICEFATCVLIAVIVSKFRERTLLPIGLMFVACFMLDFSVFLTIRLPDLDQSLVAGGNVAAPWFENAWHLVVPACAITYALMRRSDRLLTRGQARRFLTTWLPAALAATVAAIVALFAGSAYLPPLIDGEFFPIGAHVACDTADLIANAAALAVCAIVFSKRARTDVDLAVVLTVLASVAGITVDYVASSRYDAAWTMAHVAYAFGSTFVLLAAIRDLIGRSGESLRIESDQLRVQALAFERNAAVEASLVKSRFVATVSHELRTPLAGIIGMAELLERTPLNERQKQFTSAMRTSAATLLRIVNDLLDFSRAESGRLEIESRPFNVDQTVGDVVTLFLPQARRSGIALSAYVDPMLPATVVGDQVRIKQVLQNLVNNALRFTRDGSVGIEVTAETVDGELQMLKFSVRDTGIGIAKSAQAQIFDPFVQADVSTARQFGGTGLGLSIARHLVELMGGRISLVSEIGIGSTFTFTIPYRAVMGPAQQRPSLGDVSVIAIEPVPEARALLVRYLEGWEMRHNVVSSLDEARAALENAAAHAYRFDLLIVGPGIATEEATAFARAVRGDLNLAPLSALVIRDVAERRPAPHYPGFDATVSAPLRQSELFDAIVRLRRAGFAERVLPTIAGVVARPARSERILIAEDNEVNQALLVAQLEHLGFTPDMVTNGNAAVEAASAVDYDLIFLDCQMPEIDGFEAARRIREAKQRPRLPIIAVTANVLPGYRELCLAAGMSDYLAKPALIEPLASMVDRWLPSASVADAPQAPAVETSVPGADDPLADTRKRLREIFHGDEARVARVLGVTLASLRDGVATLRSALEQRDAESAARTAHRLKGVALEIGLYALAVTAGSVEAAIRKASWDDAGVVFATFVKAVEATALALETAAKTREEQG